MIIENFNVKIDRVVKRNQSFGYFLCSVKLKGSDQFDGYLFINFSSLCGGCICIHYFWGYSFIKETTV